MFKSLLLILLLLLTGCATTTAPPHTYQHPGAAEEALVISARAEHGFFTDRIFITVNGQDVLEGNVRLWRLQDTMSGTWLGHSITADCYARNANLNRLTQHFCTVVIDQQDIVRLVF